MSTNNYFERIGAWPAEAKGLTASYVWGYVLSLALTLLSYEAAVRHIAPRGALIALLLLFACAQFEIQLAYFLHLGHDTASRERFIVLGCALLIVLIIVVGSLWIMFTLNDRMMPSSAQMEEYMHNQQGI